MLVKTKVRETEWQNVNEKKKRTKMQISGERTYSFKRHQKKKEKKMNVSETEN